MIEKNRVNAYQSEEHMRAVVASGGHRNIIGGAWEQLGPLQFEYLRDQGLKPAHRLLDIGCGSLRGGVHFVDYLDTARYYGIDVSQALLDAGYAIELTRLGLHDKLPRTHLIQTDCFDLTGFDVQFDVAFALSVFSHLSQNHVRLCLHRLAERMAPGGRFHATTFVTEPHEDWSHPIDQARGGVRTYPDRDPFHFAPEHVHQVCSDTPWRVLSITDWGHPKNQKMIVFERE